MQKRARGQYAGDLNSPSGRERVVIACQIALVISICVIWAVINSHYISFVPINGTFQNYNPVRRLLNGQVPYRDFQDYLGLGHLYAGSFATLIFGGDYRDSLCGFRFLSFLCFALLVYAIGNAIVKNRSLALSMTIGSQIALIVHHKILPRAVLDSLPGFQDWVQAVLYVGNSAKMIRVMILPLLCLSVMLARNVFAALVRRWPACSKYRLWIAASACGLMAGAAFPWSNDYGISCWLCMLLMFCFAVLARTRKLTRTCAGGLVALIASAAGLLIAVLLSTRGNVRAWIGATFGTGSYQSWYYNSPKSYYIYDLDFSLVMCVQALLCLAYLVLLFKKRAARGALIRYGIPAMANMIAFCAANEYKLLSGYASEYGAFAVLLATLLSEACRFVVARCNRRIAQRVVLVAAMTVGVAWSLWAVKNDVQFYASHPRENTYADAKLGGDIEELEDDLLDAHEFLDGQPFFATYASAQEVLEDAFQPSGTDYIIHALGDRQRESYLQSFLTGDFKYTATIKDSYTMWESWVQRANWFFYRELYRDWHPAFSNSYEVYWERNLPEESHVRTGPFSVEVLDAGEGARKIAVHCDESISGIANVSIRYDTKKRDGLRAKLMFQSMVQVGNTTCQYVDDPSYETNNLKANGTENIPVFVVNGYGEALISAMPQEDMLLDVQEAACDEIFTARYEYLEAASIVDSNGQIVLEAPNGLLNRQILDGANGIEIGGAVYEIVEVRESGAEGALTCVAANPGGTPVNAEGDLLDRQTYFRVVKG